MKQPVSPTVERLRKLMLEAEGKYRVSDRPPTQAVREATRLGDEEFDHLCETPYGTFPRFSETFLSRIAPVEIPGVLRALWRLNETEVESITAVDIETAASLGGPRNMACVIGLAQTRGETCRLEQWVLRGPDDEMAVLWHLEQTLQETELLLSYNGSRFDFPLLARRYKSIGFGEFRPPYPVIDLEPFARSVFGRQGLSTKLTSLEEHLLRTARPSWVWHPAWRSSRHLTWRRRRMLARIMAKNAFDVLSLFTLLERICDVVVHPGEHAATLGVVLGRSLNVLDARQAYEWFIFSATHGLGTPEGLQAALQAWRAADEETRERLLGPALEHAVRHGVRNAWMAAERLGLEAWRKGDSDRAQFWTSSAIELSPPHGARQRLLKRLLRYGARASRNQP